MNDNLYTVWVGGIEINDYLIKCEDDAKKLALNYSKQGYKDVAIVKLNEPEQENF